MMRAIATKRMCSARNGVSGALTEAWGGGWSWTKTANTDLTRWRCDRRGTGFGRLHQGRCKSWTSLIGYHRGQQRDGPLPDCLGW